MPNYWVEFETLFRDNIIDKVGDINVPGYSKEKDLSFTTTMAGFYQTIHSIKALIGNRKFWVRVWPENAHLLYEGKDGCLYPSPMEQVFFRIILSD